MHVVAASLGQSFQDFLNSPGLGSDITKIISTLAVLFMVVGIIAAIVRHHRYGLATVARKVIEVIVVGVILAIPSIWVGIINLLVTLVQDAATYIGSNL
ncbi:MAG TPA: hypothetical protein VKV25_00805 [Acidimicrobiales bacterium]|nr:hypothetical protein [Acidimicrobiales bacterium]